MLCFISNNFCCIAELFTNKKRKSLNDGFVLNHAKGVDGIARCASAWNRHEVSHGINAEHRMESSRRRCLLRRMPYGARSAPIPYTLTRDAMPSLLRRLG